MAEFCRQCSVSMFGEPYADFEGISTEADTQNKLYPIVLCESCGPCQVYHTGKCVSIDCFEKHGMKTDETSNVPTATEPVTGENE